MRAYTVQLVSRPRSSAHPKIEKGTAQPCRWQPGFCGFTGALKLTPDRRCERGGLEPRRKSRQMNRGPAAEGAHGSEPGVRVLWRIGDLPCS